MATQAPQGVSLARASSVKKAMSGKSPIDAKDAMARVKAEVKARESMERQLSTCQEANKRLEAELREAMKRCSQLEQELERAQQPVLEEIEPVELPPGEAEAARAEQLSHTTIPTESEHTANYTSPDQPAQLIIQDIQVFHSDLDRQPVIQEKPHLMVGRFQSDEDITVQTSFLIQGPGATQITAEAYPFELNVYTNDPGGLKTIHLASHQARLVKEKFTYAIPLQIPRQSPGVYQLRVSVKVDRMLEHRKGPSILVE